ncbi:MAG: hypothetical protein AB9900_07125 [Humidesulfovibrio sp.]
MSLAHVFKHIVDGLWAAGGIGAAADLGLEDFSPAWDEPCPALPNLSNTPLEGEPCRISCPSCCSRPLSR